MVPQRPEQIAPAVRAKLATLDARLAADAASLEESQRDGRTLIDALRQAAAELNHESRDAADASTPGSERR
jgi:hypothetical protein